jgi:hypothetical protein
MRLSDFLGKGTVLSALLAPYSQSRLRKTI